VRPVLEQSARRAATTTAPPRRAPARSWILRLQRTAGNRAVRQLLQRDIAVHAGSRLTAPQFADALKKNAHVPDWLKKGIGSTRSALTAGRIAAPKDRIFSFVDSFRDAFKAGNWDITTARSKLVVTQSGGKQKWSQIVTPDLGEDERIGFSMKTGRDQYEFAETTLHSEDPEVIYGWTEPDTVTNKREQKRGLIVIITEIDVTAADGRHKVFTPGPDQVAEAILHEIGVHAGRIAEGRRDTHDDTDSSVRDVVNEIGGFFRAQDDKDELELSPLTKQIFAFVEGGKR
jgi:hypothetical protein